MHMNERENQARDLAKRWMRGVRQGPQPRSAWEHPADLAHLLSEVLLLSPLPEVGGSEPDLPVSVREHAEGQRYRDRLKALAWLHDIIEDGLKEDGTPVTVGDLRTEGVPEILIEDIVALSQVPGEEKTTYLARLDAADPGAKLVKVIDRICNLREGSACFKDKRWARYVDETGRYIMPLIDSIHEKPFQEPLRKMLVEAIALRPVVT